MTRLLYPSLQAPVLTPAQAPESVTEDRWHQPFADSIKTLTKAKTLGFAVALAASGMCVWSTNTPVSAETVTVDKWFQRPSEPLPIKRHPVAERWHFAIDAKQLTLAEATQADKWFAQFSLPVRLPRALGIGSHLVYAADKFTAPVPVNNYLQPFSEPKRFPPRLLPGGNLSFSVDAFALTQRETVTEDRWHQPFSLPVRFRLALPYYQQLAFTTDARHLGDAEQVTESRWHEAFTDPIFLKFRVLDRSLYGPYQALVKAAPFTSTPPVDGWMGSLSEPKRFPRALIAGAQREFFVDGNGLTLPESVTEDRWHQALAEPNWRRYIELAQSVRARITVVTAYVDLGQATIIEGVTLDPFTQTATIIHRPQTSRLFGFMGGGQKLGSSAKGGEKTAARSGGGEKLKGNTGGGEG